MVAKSNSAMSARAFGRSGSVRVRTTAAAVVVVGTVLVISAVAMVLLLHGSLSADVRTAALLRAHAVADGLAAGDEGVVASAGGDEEFVQILDAGGQVVASSSNLIGRPAIAHPQPGGTRAASGLPFEDDTFLVAATSATTAQGQLTVVVGRSLGPVAGATRAATGLLVVGVPLLLLVVGAVAWRVVGRALAPVEAIRAEVEAISTNELRRRVPDPSGDDEIARLATTMNRMLARLEGGQVRQRRFVSDASHELRSPVTTILQHAEVARSHPEATSIGELGEVMLGEGIRLQRLVEDLLLLARIDEGTLRLRTESVDLDDLLLGEIRRLRTTTDLSIDARGVSAGRVSGDRGQLDRLVRNLTDNAARHAHGTIVLSLREVHAKVVLAIDDDGDGIAGTECERVFDRFVRLEDARDLDSGGSGLGLAVVREIATAHRATVAVSNSALGGARFELRFPVPAG